MKRNGTSDKKTSVLCYSMPMKSKTVYLTFNTEKKIQIIRITDRVEQAVLESGVKDGLVLVNPMHILQL